MTRMTTDESGEELATRSNDGLEVALLWTKRSNRVTVCVSDANTGDAFELQVRDGDNALDLFNHPFAYAARRGVAYSDPAASYAEAA